MEQLKRVALVTGASGSGIGRSVALTLARKGTAVAVNYLHSQSSGEAVAKYINENGGCAFPVQGDVFDPLDCGRMVETVLERLGRVDICVIGPGANWNPEPVDPFSSLEEAWAFSAHGEPWRNRTTVTPQDVADCVAFLCSEEARYLTGCVLPLLF